MIGLDLRRRVWSDDDYRQLIRSTWPDTDVGRPLSPQRRTQRQHLETWLAHRRERDADGVPIPRYVERELRGYLECGILACGFARARCGACPRPPPT